MRGCDRRADTSRQVSRASTGLGERPGDEKKTRAFRVFFFRFSLENSGNIFARVRASANALGARNPRFAFFGAFQILADFWRESEKQGSSRHSPQRAGVPEGRCRTPIGHCQKSEKANKSPPGGRCRTTRFQKRENDKTTPPESAPEGRCRTTLSRALARTRKNKASSQTSKLALKAKEGIVSKERAT